MHLLAIVYLAEVYPDNVEAMSHTLTSFFPPSDTGWLLAQATSHWQAYEHWAFYNIVAEDQRSRAFRTYDMARMISWAKEGLCKNNKETREWCPFSCEVYIQEGPIWVWVTDREDEVEVCVKTRTGLEECQAYMDDSSVKGDFVLPTLLPGELFPMLWQEDHTRVTPQKSCSRVRLRPDSRSSVLTLNGMIHSAPSLQKWQINIHWISSADEKTHEEYLRVLAKGNFDLVLDAIGKYLGLNDLVAYQLTFIGVSHSVRGYIYHDTHHKGASVYNVIIPLILVDRSTTELRVADWENESKAGILK
ncbi:LOW QUALITY PROTEIN: hypothetical protein ACHAWF_005945 [Thalassiosira exigua]